MSCLSNDLRLSSRIPSKAPFLGVGLHIIYQNPHEFAHLPTRADNHERETQCNSFKVTLEMSILCLNILMVTLLSGQRVSDESLNKFFTVPFGKIEQLHKMTIIFTQNNNYFHPGPFCEFWIFHFKTLTINLA